MHGNMNIKFIDAKQAKEVKSSIEPTTRHVTTHLSKWKRWRKSPSKQHGITKYP